METTLMNKIRETVQYIRSHSRIEPSVGIILGTGLGALANEIDVESVLEYANIPYFPVSTVESHHGKLILGHLGNKPVVVMQGRFHYYEGYSMQEVVFPVRVMKFLGIRTLFISNASGGVNPDYDVSDLMIMNDHINLFPENPLRGPNPEELGERFPDMSEPYDRGLIDMALKIADEKGIKVRQGVYAALTGPNLETPAEYAYIRSIGADAVGMSTIPENIAARHMGIPVFAISVITDMGVPGRIKKVVIPDILAAASRAEPGMTLIMKELIQRIQV